MKIAIVAALVVTPAFAFMNAAHGQSMDANTRVSSATPADNTKTHQQDPTNMHATHGQSTDANTRVSSATPVDNTKSNQQDPTNMNATADDQKNNKSDVTITREIRRSVMADKTLSTYAHNAKIVAVNGTVTLNGVVRSEAEKNNLAEKAAQVVDNSHVVNELKVKPRK